MIPICDLLENLNLLMTGPEPFYAFIAFAVANTVAGVAYRAKKNNGDLSFLGKSYFTFELLNWNKYGIFALIYYILFFALILTILFLATMKRYCIN